MAMGGNENSTFFHFQSADEKQPVRESGSTLLLITNMKSHMHFRLVPKSVTLTLNGITAIILRYSTEFGSFGGQLRESG